MFVRPEKKKVPILMYHSISKHTTPKCKPFTVSPAVFAEHMAYLHKHAYTPITVSQFVNMLAQRRCALPKRPVVLTFDDGYADFFTEALPILKRYSFVATLYVATAFIDSMNYWMRSEEEAKRPILTWKQLTEISMRGIECGAHSHSHRQLDILSHSTAYNEIVLCKGLLERHLDQEISSFAYPYGYYTAAIKHLVREAGYTSACAVKNAISSETSDPFALARLSVRADTSVDALAALLTKRVPSVITTVCAHAKTSGWRLARYCSASLVERLQEGIPAG